MSTSQPPSLLPQPVSPPLSADDAIGSLLEEQRLASPQDPAPLSMATRSADEALATLEQEQQTQFFDALRVAASTDPNVYAESLRLSRELGVSKETAEKDPAYLSRLAQAVRVREMPLEQVSPVLYGKLQDIHFARLAQDDIETLSLGERIAKGWNIGMMQAERGKLAMMDRRGSLDPSEQLYAAQLDSKLRDSGNPTGFLWLPEMAKVVGQWAETIPQAVRAGAEAGMASASVAMAASAVVPPAEAVTVPTAFLTAFGVTATTELAMQSFEVEGGNAYRDMVAAGYDPQRAAWAADAVGLVGMGLEMGAAGFVTKPIRAGIMGLVRQRVAEELGKEGAGRLVLGFAIDYAKTQGVEVGQETLTEVANILGEWAASKPGQANAISEGEVVERLTAVALDTAKGMALLSLPGPVMNARTNRKRAQAAREVQAWAKQMAALPGESKAFARDPQSVADIVQEAADEGGNGVLYVDAKALGEMLRQQDKTSTEAGKLEKSAADQMEAAVPGLGAKLVEAEKVGGDVTLTTGEFVTLAAQSKPLADAMTDLVRREPEGVAPRDADAVEKESQAILDSYAEEVAAAVATGGDAQTAAAGVQGEQKAAQGIKASAKRASDRAMRESVSRVRIDVAKRLEEAATGLRPSEVSALSNGVTEALRILAEKEGITPEQAMQRYGPGITRQPLTEDALQQPSPLKTDTPEFRAWFGESKVVDAEGKPLVVYHGTDAEFTVFNADKSPLMFFSENRGTAEAYAFDRSQGRQGRVVEAFVTAASPATAADVAKVDISKEVEALAEINPKDRAYLAERAQFIKSRIAGPQGWMFTKAAEAGVWRDVLIPALKRAGFDSLRLEDAADTGGSLAVFDPTQIKSPSNRGTFDPNDPNILRQPARGGFIRRALAILFGEKSDASTVLHELTHWYTEVVDRLAQQGSPWAVQQMGVLLERWKLTREQWDAMSDQQREPLYEDISYNAEEYFATGRAPSRGLEGFFNKLRTWIVRIYRDVRGSLNAAYRKEYGVDLPPLTPELRGFFDRMLAVESAVEAATAEREQAMLFMDEKARKVAGVTEEQWASLQEFDRMAKDEAKAELTAKALQGLARFETSQNKAVREMAQKAKAKRAEVRAEAEVEVAGSAVFRAIRYLRDGVYVAQDGTTETVPEGERARLDAAAVRRILGVDETVKGPQTLLSRIREMGGINPKGYPGEKSADMRRLMPGLFSGKGMNWEELAQALEADGFGPVRPGRMDADTVGSADYSWFYEAVDDAASGLATYRRDDAAKMQSEGPQSDELSAMREKARKDYRRLVALRVVQAEGGIAPDLVAEQFGWGTGSEMVASLAASRPFAETVESRTDERMATEFGELTDPKKIRRAILEALHGEARGKFLAGELQALMRATTPTRVMMGAAKDAAKQVVRSMPVGQIDVRSFVAAEARAAKEAAEAMASGDVAVAIDAKRRHLLRHYMTLEAIKVEKFVDRFLDLVDAYFAPDADVMKSRDLDKVQALRAILAEFGLASGRQQQKAAEYMRILAREAPEEAARLQPRVTEATAEAKPYREATWDAFQVMANEVEALWYEAKRGQEFHTYDGDVLPVLEVQERLQQKAEAVLGNKPMAFGEEPGQWSLATVAAGLSRIEHYVRMLDGGDGGPWHRYVYRQVANSYTAYQARSLTEQTWWRDTVSQFDDLHGEKIPASQWLGTGVVFRDREHLLGAVYQSGNDSNLRNMVLGWGWGDQRADGTLVTNWWAFMDEMQAKGVLTEKDYQLLQSMWDRNAGELRSLMQRTNKKLFGTYVTEIQGTPFNTRFGMFKGGYAPSKVDMDHPKNRALGTAKAFDAMAQGEMDFRAQFASVPRGMTIERKNNVVRPRILSLELQGSHLDEQLRFIFVQPAISDVARLFKRGPLVNYMNQAAPKFLTDLLAPAIERVARNSLTKPGDGGIIDKSARFLRRTTSMAALGFSVRNWLQQYTGIANVVPYTGVGHAWHAFWNYRGASGQSTALAVRKSPFMAVTLDEKMAKVQEDLRQLFEPNAMGKAREWVSNYAFFLQRMADFQVKVIAWNAAYSRALEDIGTTMDPTKADAEAVQRADSVVRRSQGSRNPFDAPNYATQTALWQLFTQFSEYPNLVLNQIMLAKDKREMAAAVMMALLVPTIVSGAITLALSGGRAPGSKTNDGDDDRDGRMDDEWAAYLFGQAIKGAGAMLPVIGPALATAISESDDRWTAAPAISTLQAFMRVGQGRLFPAWDDDRRARQEATPGGAFTPQDARDASLVVGALLGIVPTGPVGRAWSYWENVDAGKAEANNAFQVLRGMLNGR
jgi:hypothetical protein